MRYSYLFFLTLLSYLTTAQEGVTVQTGDESGLITFTNPSFEDYARVAYAPRGWTDCGFPGESAVDVQPDPQRTFQTVKPAQHGNTYLGMVTRDNDTHERVGQRMSIAMRAGQCYELRIQLARSELYMSRSRVTDQDANYINPIKLRIRGGFGNCDLREVIGESPLVANWDWQEFRIKLRPAEDYTHIVLEAFWKQPILFPYNGNILVDNAQPLRPVACDEDLYEPRPDEELLVVEENKSGTPLASSPRTSRPPATSAPTSKLPPAPAVRLGNTRGELRVDQVFEVDVPFKANSAELEDVNLEAIADIANFLRHNPRVVVEIGGHASYFAGSIFADRISKDRAEAVVEQLLQLNIGPAQLISHGYGRTRPVCRDNTPECKARNQRVEVKILKVRS